jgi:hypothetical protein
MLAVLALLTLAGCGEKPQEPAGRTVRGGAQAWEGPKTAFTAPGWTVGDRASWAAHLQTRAQTMNEYMRIDIGK